MPCIDVTAKPPPFEQKRQKASSSGAPREGAEKKQENSKRSLSHHRFPFLYEIGYIFVFAHYPAFLCALRITSAAKHFRFRLCTKQIYSSLLSRNKHQKFYKTIQVSRKVRKKEAGKEIIHEMRGRKDGSRSESSEIKIDSEIFHHICSSTIAENALS